MCGIWGFVGTTTSVHANDAWAGLCSLTDRGPDDWGMYFDGVGKVTEQAEVPTGAYRVALGNRRLSILDLSAAGNQPMGGDGGTWIVYNGEVYNYRELRAELKRRGYEFESNSDTEVILRAYEEYGRSCVEHLRGMFAFAIYDAGDEQLFAARDRFGIKPFYYAIDEDRMIFASEVTALVESGGVRRELDLESVDGYLSLGYVPGPKTILREVSSLPPGSRARFDVRSGEFTVDRYWSQSFGGGGPADAGRVRELLLESVDLRLRSDVPVGAFLSGGLDSSTIVALMREASEPNRGDLHTFSIGFDIDGYSETDFAERVAERFGTKHTSRTVTAADVEREMDDIVAAMDQPTIDGVNTYFVSKLAAEAGLKVVLSGLGSDELLFGYPSFRTVPRRYQLLRSIDAVPRGIRRLVADLVDRAGSFVRPSPAGKIADALRSAAPFGAAYLTERGIFTTTTRSDLLHSTHLDWDEAIERDVSDTVSDVGPADAVSQTELTWYMGNQLLSDTDAMSMSHSLEVRVPFLDTRFAEYAMRASTASKRGGEKSLLKDAVRDVVPLEVVQREKSGFSFPFDEWLRDGLGNVVDRALSPEYVAATPIDADGARSIRRSFEDGSVHWSRLWALVVLSLWIRTHLSEPEDGSVNSDR